MSESGWDHSASLDNLAAALAAAQADLRPVAKVATNPFFKSRYADLPAVVAAARPVLAKHGLSVTQLLGCDEHGDTLTTVLLHTSGQYVASTMRLRPVKGDPQSQGSAASYARRYALMAVLGLVAEGEDDDGNAASVEHGASHPTATGPGVASDKQRSLIRARAKAAGLGAGALSALIRQAAGSPPVQFTDPAKAEADVTRLLERLPWPLVDPILTAIGQAQETAA